MSRASRDKGARGEREFVKVMRGWLGDQVKRRLGQARDCGHDIDGLEGFAVEVKRCERVELSKWWRQAVTSAKAAEMRPAVAYRRSGDKWRVMVELTPEEFATIVREQMK